MTEFRDVMFHTRVGDGPIGCGALAIGHSHLTTVQHAYKQRIPAAEAGSATKFLFLQLLNEEFRPPIIADDGGVRINKRLEAAILDGVYNLPQRKVIAMFLSGNEYQFIGMFNQPRRYDFLLPERPDLPPQPGAEVIQTALIEEKLGRNIRAATQLVPIIKALVGSDIPIYAMQSPPPIPDNDYILKGNSAFARELETLGVAPPSLRYKLWMLQSRLFRKYLTDAGVFYLPPPAAAVDEAGYMVPAGWHPDGVHGSLWFGDLLLQQIEGLFVVPAVSGDQS